MKNRVPKLGRGKAVWTRGCGAWVVMVVVISACMVESVGWAAHPEKEQDGVGLTKVEELTKQYEDLYEEGKYSQAIPMAEQACSILKKKLRERSEEWLMCASRLGVLYREQGLFNKAEPLLKRTLAIRERTLGLGHSDTCESLNNLGSLYIEQGHYDLAQPLLEKALEALEAMAHVAPSEIATAANTLGYLYKSKGEYEKARVLVERALSIRVETLGAGHPRVAESIHDLALIYRYQGDVQKAELYYLRALEIWEDALGTEHPFVAQGLHNLGTLYWTQGEYEKAELRYERALAIWEKVLGPDHPSVAMALNGLATQYWEQGEYAKAVPLQERALAMKEAAMGPSHPSVAISLNSLSMSYMRMGECKKSHPLLERALSIREAALGPDHPAVVTAVVNLALSYKMQKRYDEAEALYGRARDTVERMLGHDHPQMAFILNNLATLHGEQGQYKTAQPLLEQALEIREKNLGSRHPLVAHTLTNIALNQFNLGQQEYALLAHYRALEIEQATMAEVLMFSGEDRRLAYAATLSVSIDHAISSHLNRSPGHALSADFALSTILNRKGRVLDLATRSGAAIRQSLPEKDRHLLEDLALAHQEYAQVISAGRGALTASQYAERLAALQQLQHSLWREISKNSNVANRLSEMIRPATIQQALPADGVLVEFVRYHHHRRHRDWSSTPDGARYAAYLIFPNHLDWVDLGSAVPIERHVRVFRKALQLKMAVPTDLYDVVMRPIVERLDNSKNLFIAPDADLNLVPFGALYDGEQYLVERYRLYHLTTGRDVLRPWDSEPTTGDDTVMVVANPAGAELPGTEREAVLLKGLFPHVETLLDDAATKGGARRRTQPWVLHLATHGFFEVPEPDPRLQAQLDEYAISMTPSYLQFAPGQLTNPMLHLGLVLASDNTPAGTTTGIDEERIATDGRLTAYEISGWDLRGTELVVLSACGTGLGEPRTGEGVFGLRRAFAMAGAQTQVMSMWDVSDAMTAKLMEAYYRKLLAGKGRAEAMQEVQLEMLRSGKAHPGDWASFVVVGEWRSLSKDRLPKPESPPPVESRGCGCQRASVGGDGVPSGMVLFGFLSSSMVLRRRRRALR